MDNKWDILLPCLSLELDSFPMHHIESMRGQMEQKIVFATHDERIPKNLSSSLANLAFHIPNKFVQGCGFAAM